MLSPPVRSHGGGGYRLKHPPSSRPARRDRLLEPLFDRAALLFFNPFDCTVVGD